MIPTFQSIYGTVITVEVDPQWRARADVQITFDGTDALFGPETAEALALAILEVAAKVRAIRAEQDRLGNSN